MFRTLLAAFRPDRPTTIVITTADGTEVDRIEVQARPSTLLQRLGWVLLGRPY